MRHGPSRREHFGASEEECGAASRAARRWLSSRGLPCWARAGGKSVDSMYDLLLPSGGRILVRPWPVTGASFEDMAAARCEYLLAVEMSPPGGGGPVPAALVTLADAWDLSGGDPFASIDLRGVVARNPAELAVLEGVSAHPRLSFLLRSAWLLLAGEPATPPPELNPRSRRNPVPPPETEDRHPSGTD
ncbi:MAG TPA: hypothetical protein PLV86_05630 [Candidatus Fermentibacter daniensis]|nr:hypothetical protein [Candidatus Fermentibacter sp.]NLI02718.1 hypothetical protein [Candidatus Fermentibacter daniensis]MCC6871317.1 hypothetical protein [Candidatus Fermentibacter sp.]HOD19735.1 hypothetical protein [Candidatus Fermentibacter daniensis]HOG53893.1 hypothetical protein [Candidatus Fermentibacter daniensis]